MPASDTLPALVLDTNAVLDWLLFGDPGMAACVAAIESGGVRWLSCTRAIDELGATLQKPLLRRWNPDRERMFGAVHRYASVQVDPAPSPIPALRCSDADDQVFLDLALAHGARWLLTHDRALLKLARRAAPLGVQITVPAAWSISAAAAPAGLPGSLPTALRPGG